MKIDKKYAIRKLAVGVASVSIGFFVANASNLLDIPETNKIGISEVKAAEKGHLDSEPWTTTRYQDGMEITKDPGDKYGYFTEIIKLNMFLSISILMRMVQLHINT